MANAAPGWDLYRTFLAVLREGSLSGAARALDLAQPTVGRHVDALEQGLGLQLFTRSRDGLTPTDAARELAPHAEAMAATAASLLRAASGQGPAQPGGIRGAVRVTASQVVGVEVLPPILAGLQADHPGLVIELVLSNALDNLLRRDADIAVRMVAPRQEALLARRVGSIELGLHAHRSYLARRGTPRQLRDLDGHALIGFDQETPWHRDMGRRLPTAFGREIFAFRSDSDVAQLAAMRAGCGIAICQANIARRDPDLVRLLQAELSLQLEIWVAMHEDLRASPRYRLVFDALVEGLGRYVGSSDRQPAGG